MYKDHQDVPAEAIKIYMRVTLLYGFVDSQHIVILKWWGVSLFWIQIVKASALASEIPRSSNHAYKLL